MVPNNTEHGTRGRCHSRGGGAKKMGYVSSFFSASGGNFFLLRAPFPTPYGSKVITPLESAHFEGKIRASHES
jgi:hypothetical protein